MQLVNLSPFDFNESDFLNVSFQSNCKRYVFQLKTGNTIIILINFVAFKEHTERSLNCPCKIILSINYT